MHTTPDQQTANLALAGEDFQWVGVANASRPRSDAFPGLVAWLAMAQNGTCAACGEAFGGELLNVNHLVSQGKSQRGYVAGNLYLGHRTCNEIDAEVYGAVVPLGSLARPDLVPADYPTRATMLTYAGKASDTKARRMADRRARHDG